MQIYETIVLRDFLVFCTNSRNKQDMSAETIAYIYVKFLLKI